MMISSPARARSIQSASPVLSTVMVTFTPGTRASWASCVQHDVARCATICFVKSLWWDEEDARYILTRSERYPGATDIVPG